MADNFDIVFNSAAGTPIETADLIGWTDDELDQLKDKYTVGSTDWYAILNAYGGGSGAQANYLTGFAGQGAYSDDVRETYLEESQLASTGFDWMEYYKYIYSTGDPSAITNLNASFGTDLYEIDKRLHPENYIFDDRDLIGDIPIIGEVLNAPLDVLHGAEDLGEKIDREIIEPFVEPSLELFDDLTYTTDILSKSEDVLIDVLDPILQPFYDFGKGYLEELAEANEFLADVDDTLNDLFGGDDSTTTYDFPAINLDSASEVYASGGQYGRRETIYSDLPKDWKTQRTSQVKKPSANTFDDYGFGWAQ